MHPVLFEILGFPVSSYGAALSLAFAIGIAVAAVRARRVGLETDRMLDMSMWILVSSLVGARLLYVALHWSEFRPPEGTLLDVVNPFGSGDRPGIAGLSVLGGLPAALLAAFAYLRWKRLPILAYMDVAAPSIALGAGITRVGCFLNGCCFGTRCEWPVAVAFPPGSPAGAALPGALLHPTQLYQALAGFALFGLLLLYERRRPAPGAVVAALFLGMGLQRFAVELVRHPGPGGAYQWIALGIAATAGIALTRISARSSG